MIVTGEDLKHYAITKGWRLDEETALSWRLVQDSGFGWDDPWVVTIPKASKRLVELQFAIHNVAAFEDRSELALLEELAYNKAINDACSFLEDTYGGQLDSVAYRLAGQLKKGTNV